MCLSRANENFRNKQGAVHCNELKGPSPSFIEGRFGASAPVRGMVTNDKKGNYLHRADFHDVPCRSIHELATNGAACTRPDVELSLPLNSRHVQLVNLRLLFAPHQRPYVQEVDSGYLKWALESLRKMKRALKICCENSKRLLWGKFLSKQRFGWQVVGRVQEPRNLRKLDGQFQGVTSCELQTMQLFPHPALND